MEKTFLPVGSVVVLKEGTKKLMIIGFCVINNDDAKIYDYAGCMYPEGMVNPNEVYLFDNDQIDNVFFKGFENEEETSFKKNLSEVISKYYDDSSNQELVLEELSEEKGLDFDIDDRVLSTVE